MSTDDRSASARAEVDGSARSASTLVEVERLARRVTLATSGIAVAIGLGGMLEVSIEHRALKATAGTALVLLLASLACSPIATMTARPALAVALRRARRWLGLEAALVAAIHATIGTFDYLGGLELSAFAVTPWLRHGALALAILGALSLTSFPSVTRALRVRAWSALHRLAYVAALLVGLHALAAPLADVAGGVFTVAAVIALLLLRPLAIAVAARRRQSGS